MNIAITLLIKATLVLTLSSLLLFVFRKASASLRHWLISMTLIGLLVLPFCSNFLPNLEVEVPIMKENLLTQPTDNELANNPPTLSTIESKRQWAKDLNVSETITQSESITAPPLSNFSFINVINWGQLLVIIWLLGSLISLLRLFLGTLKIQQLTLSGQVFESPYLKNKPLAILCSSKIETPMTWGFGKAKILLPMVAHHWSKETLETVLLHEYAHIQRKDYWIHFLSLVSASFYWFHPMVWWMKKRQILEREKACDEYVLQMGLSNNVYAEQLVKVARFLSNPSKIHAQYALPMAQVSQLKQRISAILDFQKERFQFTKIKQWQWATFYVSLILLLSAFTPIKKSGIVERITAELPILAAEKLPTLSFTTKPLVIIPMDLSEAKYPSKEEESELTPLISPLENKISTTNPLPTKLRLLMTPIESPKIKIPKHNQLSGSIGSWKNGNSQFRVSSLGNFKCFDRFPYIEVEGAEDMVIIEEFRNNKKTIQVLITKAPFAGAIIQDFRHKKPNSWSGHYYKNSPLYLWTVNKEWKFLSERQLYKWMKKILPKVSNQVTFANFLQKADDSNQEWIKVIHAHKTLKNQRFWSFQALDKLDYFAKSPKKQQLPKIDWSAIPYQASKNVRPIGKWRKVGKTIATNTTSTDCPASASSKFGKIFRNLHPSILKSFNFNIRLNHHKTIDFKLQLYQVIDNKISHRILTHPIKVEGVSNDKHRWVRIDLSRQKINAQGDILAILEVDKVHQPRKNGCLSLSHAIGFYKSFQTTTPHIDWDFYDQNFAFYFTTFE